MIVCIGDIHGRYDILERILGHYPDDTHYVFLGDVIDRGPQNRAAMKAVLDLHAAGRATVIRGNHEEMALMPHRHYQNHLSSKNMREYQRAFEDFRNWREAGGETVIREYQRFTIENYPEDLLAYLELGRIAMFVGPEGITDYPQEGSVLVSHAAPPHARGGHTPEDVAMWIRPYEGPFPLPDGVVMSIHGHTPTLEPMMFGKHLFIDTGGYNTGRICCVRLDGFDPNNLEVTVFQGMMRKNGKLHQFGRPVRYQTVRL
ncbi:metallophosphoesterase [Deinococcus roseus]|uniref:Phosphoprotein phosphatase n=1 Tax=Deinococcus roseus TaxID=392414 RepID=A0ABQ2CV43_9DEIO|nr:metallophosphoesterase [Deinococcus roseus]GGJ23708.1 phosphoprotein phosphatase [Deinococcus roseus]